MSQIDPALFTLAGVDRTKSRSEAVLNRLAELISEGHVAVGDTLPPESEIAAQFNVSKPTVREALRKLEIMGVIEIVHGRGSFVRRISAQPLQFFLRLAVGSLEDGIAEIIEFRRAMEVSAAGLAAVNGTSEQREKFELLMGDMESAAETHDDWVTWDLTFHTQISEMTGNTLIAFMVEAMCPIMGQSISMLHGQKQLRDTEMTLQRHVAIAQTISDRDPVAAQKAMEAHFDATLPVTIALVSGKGKLKGSVPKKGGGQ